jgi:hypothetical protein
MLWIALIAMMAACLVQHLGLSQAIASVVSRVAKCPKCLAFWTTILVLLILGCNPFVALVLSLLMSYLSHFFGLVLMVLNKIYDRLWQRGNK